MKSNERKFTKESELMVMPHHAKPEPAETEKATREIDSLIEEIPLVFHLGAEQL